jgi:glycosyltransferase involved in cell wall biosynthesis
MRVAFGMIVLNGNYVLRQCLEAVYPFANQILVAEGPVKYWQDRGMTTSTDGTNETLESFPDVEHKIVVHHGQYNEKDDQCNAYMQHLRNDNDYLWNLDSDEVFKSGDIEKLLKMLEAERYTSVGFKSCTFFGGFTHKLTGFEERAEFHRVHKIWPGSTWLTHRPPKVKHAPGVITWPDRHLDFNTLSSQGIRMYHYSYVFPKQVREKVAYYKACVSRENCIDDYFNKVWLPWVKGNAHERLALENQFNGVHEYVPSNRGDCRTELFNGEHPVVIARDRARLQETFDSQLKECP